MRRAPVLLLLLLAACSGSQGVSSDPEGDRSKMDLLLQQQLMAASADEMISAMVRLSDRPDAERSRSIQATGVRFTRHSETILSVRGTARQILELSQLVFVVRMEGARRLRPSVRR